MEIKNLKKTANRILEAISNKEKIILYGDADLDGVASLILLKETIKNLGGPAGGGYLISAVYFPDREEEGYGINKKALNTLKEKAPALFIALDCGISNFEEISLAKKLGFEVILIEHHEVLDKLPAAEIIVDPKQKSDKYPFKELATVGIVYKLTEILLEGKSEMLRKSFLELVALATIADSMPQENENKIMIEEGLKSIENSWRPGIKALFQEKFFGNYQSHSQKVSKIISILNIRDIENNLPASFRLLTSSSFDEVKKIVSKLIEKSFIRREKIKEITSEIEERISKKDEKIIFEGDSSWELILLGSIASTISQKYQKPTFLFKMAKKESQGTARSAIEFDLVEAMKNCANFLETFGGHKKAAGFRAKNENLEKFKNCLIKNFKQQ